LTALFSYGFNLASQNKITKCLYKHALHPRFQRHLFRRTFDRPFSSDTGSPTLVTMSD